MERNPSFTDSDRVWLVKSSTKLVGPFSVLEISEYLGRRQISIIDEIKGPNSRWVFLREHPSFKEIIKSVRYEQDNSREETVTTATSTSHTITRTDPGNNDDFTPTPTFRSSSLPSPAAIKDVSPTNGSKANARIQSHSKTFASSEDPRILQKQKSNQRMIWGGSLLAVIAILVGGFYFKRAKTLKSEKTAEYYYQAAIRQRSLGLYEKALESYRSGKSISPPEREVKLQLLPVLLSMDGQTVELRKEYEIELQRKDLSKFDISDMNDYIGLSYLIDRDYEQASKYFKLAISTSPANLPAIYNLATIALAKKNKEEFKTMIRDLAQNADADLMAALLKAKMIILNHSDESDADIADVLKRLHSQVLQSADFKREISFISFSLSKLIHDSAKASFFGTLFLEAASKGSREFQRDLRFDNSIFDWEWLATSCQSLANSGNATDKMVFAVCAQLTGLQTEGFKILNEVLVSGQKGREVVLAQAQTLILSSRFREAQVVLRSYDSSEDIPVNLLMGEACLKGADLSCAQEAFARVNLKSPQDVQALEGMGRVAFKLGQVKLARDYVRQALLIEANYLPAIDLRDTLEKME